MNDVQDLALIIDSKISIVALETFDEKRALEMLTRLAIKKHIPLQCWSVTEGLKHLGFGERSAGDESCNPINVLRMIKKQPDNQLFVLCDFHAYLEDPQHIRLLKDIALGYGGGGHHTIVLLSHKITIPPELSRLSASFSLSLPSDEQIMTIVREEAKLWGEQNQGSKVKTDKKALEQLVLNLRGVGFSDVKRLVRGAIRDDGAITESDIPQINKAKFQLMNMDGVLSFEYNTDQFSNVGGLDNLKSWLSQRKQAFLRQASTDGDTPKGIMLLGVQGSGKSLAAKAVAGMWGVPLLRLDFAALYNKYIGETEKNLREALSLADLMEPCVLWIDEIEKGLSSQGNDEGTSKRILGTLLTWMAERTSQVFIVATSNDITGLPPELVRKGRLDEIFFVDLPDNKTRQHIFSIHLKKRNKDPLGFNLEELSLCSDGFSGSEIEQAIVAANYTASARGEELNTQLLIAEINQTSPISVVMAEKIKALRAWSANRTVQAN